MPTPTLSTKLFVPSTRKEQVSRQRLINRLNQGLDGKLTLVSGPAGFGKTTLLSEWIAQSKRPVGWVSLDERDNDWNRFTLYLIKAFQKISDGFAHEIIEMLSSVKHQNSEIFLPYFINQISEIQEHFLIVLDDYHVITETKIHNLIFRILENQPPQMHMVISTRSDPPWPLARWRAGGELSEIRLGDLRFTLDETSTFLSEVVKVNLSLEDIKRLDTRTEGWVAGLQMAAVSIQTQDDISGFIQRFTGSHRFVFDYLMDEVFRGLSPEIQDFLLKTSILDRLCAQLCNYVREANDSQKIIDQLEQMNLFVIPLDDHRSWYRYHHLFAGLMRQIAKQKLSEQMSDIHSKAREWYQSNALISDAIHHGFAEGNIDQVADLIEKNFIDVLEHRDLIMLTRWLEACPPAVIQSRPWLSVAYAFVLLTVGTTDAVTRHIQQAESSINNFSKQEKGHILSYIAFIRAELSALSGDMIDTINYARKVLKYLPQGDERLRCSAASTLGTALQRCGLFEDAALAFAEGITAGRTIGDSNAVISLYGDLVGLYIERGQLYQAHATCQEALQYIERSFQKYGRYTPGAGHIYLRLSTILRHWGDLDGSLNHAQKSNRILEKWGLRYRLNFINLAIALHAVGNYPEAHQVMREAEQVARDQSEFWVDDVKARKALFWLTEGNLRAALQWASEQNLDTQSEISFQNQRLYQTLAQIRLVQGQNGDGSAMDDLQLFLPQLIQVVDDSSAVAYLIQTLILQALAFQTNGDRDQAKNVLNKALTLGEQGGFMWIFIREGEPMEKLLQYVIKQGNSTPYVQKLMSTINNLKEDKLTGSDSIQLADPLTDRELELLRYLDSDLTILEIAETLVISIGTVRTHIKRIYRKLDAHSRFEATTKGEKLHLL